MYTKELEAQLIDILTDYVNDLEDMATATHDEDERSSFESKAREVNDLIISLPYAAAEE